MQLNQELAQQIAEKTMEVLGRNVNIMDRAGIIVGSGKRERLNTYHEGAARVLSSGQRLVVKKEGVEALPGAEEGIYLPIKFNEEIVGVVGITGSPQDVVRYGELVRNLVQLMLVHAFLMQEIELERKSVENFYQQVLGNEIEDHQTLINRAQFFQIEPTVPRRVLVVRLRPFAAQKVNQVTRELNLNLQVDKQRDILLVRGRELVLVKTLAREDRVTLAGEARQVAEEMLASLDSEFSKVAIGVGPEVGHISELHYSYAGASDALRLRSKIGPAEDRIHFSDELAYDYCIPHLDRDSARFFLENVFAEDAAAVFAEPDVGEIIEGLVENNLNISKTADSLFIHRNTLLYRTNKIRERTGYDPKKAKDLFTLLLAYHIYRYFRED